MNSNTPDIPKFKLSFDDSRRKIEVYGLTTIATIVSYFKVSNIEDIFKYLGFEKTPEFIYDYIRSAGYKYDAKKNAFRIRTVGVAIGSNDDQNIPEWGRNLALTRAKVKAYEKANEAKCQIRNLACKLHTFMDIDSDRDLVIFKDELSALDRCEKTMASIITNKSLKSKEMITEEFKSTVSL